MPAGPLADGKLTNDELRDVLLAAAHPAPMVYFVWAPTFIFTHGLVNSTAEDLAQQILLGQAEPPPKPQEDEWFARWTALRGAYWG